MNFRFTHNCISVSNLERSKAFYEQALGLKEVKRREAEDGSFILSFLSDGVSDWQLELSWLREHPQPYELGENEIHFCLVTDDYAAAMEHHRAMDCICFENTAMGLYFIEDPDGYWVEILPAKR